MIEDKPAIAEYRCPGQGYPISRSVHLGRLARSYPGCRRCPHREDTGSLPARRAKQLVETRGPESERPLFDDEGISGVELNRLTPPVARRLAAAFGMMLRGGEPPTVAIAFDGRPATAPLLAAVGEGLRWAGCRAVELGAATAPCVAFAADHLLAAGGLLVGNPAGNSAGNPGGRPHTVGMRFWAPGPLPLSVGSGLERLESLYETGVDRPTRRFGPLGRFHAEAPYLTTLAEHYHALRPLRFLLRTSSRPLVRYVETLVRPLACRMIRTTAPDARMPAEVAAAGAHFALAIDDDGERATLFDEQGRPVPPERLLLLLARHQPGNGVPDTVVLEQGTSPGLADALTARGVGVSTAAFRRSDMARAMRHSGAALGGGPSGRFWHTLAGPPLPDALMTLTLLLELLSQRDRSLSDTASAPRAPAG